MKFQTAKEYRQEIARVKAVMDSTSSDHLRRDYDKYIKRLKREMRVLFG